MRGVTIVLAALIAVQGIGLQQSGGSASSKGIIDNEETGVISIDKRIGGSHRKPGINIDRGSKHGTPGHRGSHHKRRHPHADKHRDPASPGSPEPRKRWGSDAYIDSSILNFNQISYLPGLNTRDGKPRPGRRAPRPAPTRPAGPTPDEIRAWSIDIATGIRLAKPVIDIEPRPSANKWNITAVGQPLWFHNPGAERHTASDSAHGIVVSLDAQRVDTVYETGEKTIRCTHSTPRPANADPRAQSPHCGYIYQHPGNYTLRMTEVWKVGWQSGDQSGEIVTTRSSSKPLKVNELIGVLTKPGVQ